MHKVGTFYVYRGEWIVRNGPGWSLECEMCSGSVSGIPIYRTLQDAKNAIRKRLDGTQAADPRIVATAGFDGEAKEYFVE